MNKKKRDLLIALCILATIIGLVVISRIYSNSYQANLPSGKPNLQSDSNSADSTNSKQDLDKASEDKDSKDLPFGAISLADFTGKKMSDGSTFEAKKFENKVVVANFWATWCHYCVAEMPHFQKVYDKYKNDDRVDFIFANLTGAGGDTEEKVHSFLKENNYTFPVLFDENVEVFRKLGVRGTPVTAFLSHKGRSLQVSNFNGHSLYYHMGLMDEQTLEDYIKAALSLREEELAKDNEAVKPAQNEGEQAQKEG